MKKNELLEIIKKGENSYIEFKEEGIKAKELGEEFVAFANSEGGTVLIGICDDGRISGVKSNLIEEKIMNICRNNCIPNIIPLFEIVEIDEKKIAVITILKGLSKPYYTIDNKYYIRSAVLRGRFSGENPCLRVAAERWSGKLYHPN